MTVEEYKELVKQINYHMDLYYNRDTSEISDQEYDLLMQQLKTAEREHPEFVTPESPSQRIGGTTKREAGVKVTHNVPMLSIEDVFTKEDVAAWVEKVQSIHPDAAFSVEQKIDGLSMTLRYRNGKLELAETRGDGRIGEDVTANAKVIEGVRQTLDIPWDYLELRGEVYMNHENFERFNKQQEEAGKKPAANPRNLAAGTLRQLDAAVTKQRGLFFFVFNVQDGPQEVRSRHVEGLDLLREKGVQVVFHRFCRTTQEVLEAIDEIGRMRSDLPYDIDGAVVKIDQSAYRNDFPAGSKYTSGHIAYKYPPEEKSVILDRVEETVGRTGKIGFIGHVHDPQSGGPVRLGGTNVSRVTLHNQDYIQQMQIGLGGTYRIKKSGDIIPKICAMEKPPRKVYEASKTCPACGSLLVREPDTADIRCLNAACPVQLSRTISYFTSLGCMNILGLGETLVQSLVEEGYLKSYADIYHLKEYRDELIEKGILGKEKNTDKLLAAIERSKENEPDRLLAALGIRNVGRSTARSLMASFRSIQDLARADVEQLMAVPDIGETTAECIRDFFQNPENERILESLEENGVLMEMPEQTEQPGSLLGLTIVITGTLPTLGRREAEELVVKNGGKCTSSVSRKTSYVLAGEAAGSKLEKAVSLGIPVIDEARFLEMIGQS